ncbi:MAG TPA: DUF445 family protein [Opitutales bacterium]|nr:DUF445 family protein [Opitutales bacterium]
MNPLVLISIPIVTGLIGWITNWLAIRMLFRPRNPVTLLGIKWQGLIPRRQSDLAEKTAEIIESELLQQHTIRELIKGVNLEPHMEHFVGSLIEKRLRPRLAAIPFVGSFVSDETIQMVKEMGLASVKEELPGMVDRIALDIESRIQVREIVRARMNALDLGQLEAIVLKVAHKEFRTIEQLGAVLGTLVGLFQVGILLVLG